MTLEFFLLLAAGSLAGGFINGLAGFGTSLFALGWWLQIMPPLEAVAMALFMSVASGIQGIIVVWKHINYKRLAWFLLPALLGVPIGIELLAIINPSILKIGIAVFLILYGGFFAFRKGLTSFTQPTNIIDGIIGFFSGILGAVAGLSGSLPTMWIALRPWPKHEQRGILQPFNIVILSLSATILAYQGAYSKPVLLNLAIAIPLSIIAAQVGIIIFKRLKDYQFKRLLIFLLLIAGISLMARELLL